MGDERYRDGRGYGRDRDEARRDRDRGGYGGGQGHSDRGYGYRPDGGAGDGRGGYAAYDDYAGDRRPRGGARPPHGRDEGERGFLDRAGDEVRSWFGDDEAERRRERDAREDAERDAHYRSWRQDQMAALDRDYDEYRQENRARFEREFASWRTERQGQRSALGRVAQHMAVVGADGGHVGTVDTVRGDRIVLTRSDGDAGGRHHSIPSRWIDRVEDTVVLRKTADEAQGAWRDEGRDRAFFGDDGRDDGRGDGRGGGGGDGANRRPRDADRGRGGAY